VVSDLYGIFRVGNKGGTYKNVHVRFEFSGAEENSTVISFEGKSRSLSLNLRDAVWVVNHLKRGDKNMYHLLNV
jgi:hypothetical protein